MLLSLKKIFVQIYCSLTLVTDIQSNLLNTNTKEAVLKVCNEEEKTTTILVSLGQSELSTI